MNSLKEAFNTSDKDMRCSPPYMLRLHAEVARQSAEVCRPDLQQFHLDLACLYDRMADAREAYWEEYKQKCLALEE